jgi:hypothetical protein
VAEFFQMAAQISPKGRFLGSKTRAKMRVSSEKLKDISKLEVKHFFSG